MVIVTVWSAGNSNPSAIGVPSKVTAISRLSPSPGILIASVTGIICPASSANIAQRLINRFLILNILLIGAQPHSYPFAAAA